MKAEIVESFPPNSNPFHHDIYNMGVKIGSNCTIMISTFSSDKCHSFYIVNTVTGERIRITL